MISRRTIINLISFLVITIGLTYVGITRFLFPEERGDVITMETTNAAGVLPRSDVTVRGVPSGVVRDVRLTEEGTAEVAILLNPGVSVPEGSVAEITRRSPIGDITINMVPGDGPPLPHGGRIPIEDTVPAPEAVETIKVLQDVLGAVPPEQLAIVTSELATALRGRGDDLGALTVAGADLQERILQVRTELESLIRTGPQVTGVFADNAPTLADDITQTAILADILRDRRFDLVDLMRSGAEFTEVLGELLGAEKANIACLVQDFGNINRVLARPHHLQNLKRTLELNHFFFDGVKISVRTGKDGLDWFRVHFLPPQEPMGRTYVPRRPPPDVFPAHACTSRYGPGVGPGTQEHEPALVRGSQIRPGR